MATNVEKLNYAVSPEFKGHIFEGTSKVERDAQNSFINRIAFAVLRAPVEQGDYKSNLWGFIRWIPSGLDNIFSLLVTVRGEIASLREEVKQLATLQGAQIDYDKVGEASAKALAEYVDNVETTTKVTLKES